MVRASSERTGRATGYLGCPDAASEHFVLRRGLGQERQHSVYASESHPTPVEGKLRHVVKTSIMGGGGSTGFKGN